MNAGEVKEMVAAAKESNVFFMEAMWTRYFPTFTKLQEWLSQNKIGKVATVTASFGFLANPDVPRLGQKDKGAGALLDVGTALVVCVIHPKS